MTGYYLFILARRSAVFWLLVRIMLLLLGAFAQLPINLLPITGVFVVVFTAALLLIDLRLSGEEVLVANLGVSRGPIVAVSFFVIGILESITQVAL